MATLINEQNNQWEIVAKSKKQKNLERKVIAHTEQKRIIAMGPKLEELMSTRQYENLLMAKTQSQTTKEKQSPTQSSSSGKSKSPTKRNVKAKSTNGVVVEAKKTNKAATKKSLEAAMRNIKLEDVNTHMHQTRTLFPSSKIRWLCNLATYLNSQLDCDTDAIYSGKSVDYPLVLANKPLKIYLYEYINSVDVATIDYFYHTLLDSLATEMNINGTSANGYKLFLQMIGQTYPDVCCSNLAKTAMLRNSYQNCKNICLSILWAVGQGGYQSLTVGVKVWQNLMVPLINSKNYSKFVIHYIEKILKVASDQRITLPPAEFFVTFNTLQHYNSIEFPKEFHSSLLRSADLILQNYIKSTTKHAFIFETFLKKINCDTPNHIELQGMLRCLKYDPLTCFQIWRMYVKKKPNANFHLVKTLSENCAEYGDVLIQLDNYGDFMYNVKYAVTKDDHFQKHISTLKSAIYNIQQKKAKNGSSAKKSGGCCKWLFGSFLLLALIAAAISYDTHANGKGHFKHSATGKTLQSAGLLPHVQKAWYISMSSSARAYKWAEVNVPPYAKPAAQLSIDLYKLAKNGVDKGCNALQFHFNAKWPVVAKFIDGYLPGVSKKMEVYAAGVKTVYADVLAKSVGYIKKNVLVGRFSPENINKALNETQNLASEYYVLFQKKVDTYAKLK